MIFLMPTKKNWNKKMEKEEFKKKFLEMVYDKQYGKYYEFKENASVLTELVEEYLGIDYQSKDGHWTLDYENNVPSENMKPRKLLFIMYILLAIQILSVLIFLFSAFFVFLKFRTGN